MNIGDKISIFEACKIFNDRVLGLSPINLRTDFKKQFRAYTTFNKTHITENELQGLINSYNDNHVKILNVLK